MANLKPWFHVVQPREDLRQGKPLDASEFAVHLDHVRAGRAPDVYQRPEQFFDRTYLTHTLLDLAAQVARRLSGELVETSAVFNLATQFGGGKTHALTLLYHLAQAGPAADDWRGVRSILQHARVTNMPKAQSAVFVGTEFDALTGRGGDDGTPLRKTPWGEIAWQLGGERAFAAVARHDADGTAPGGDPLRAMLPDGPVLILMDELLNFASRSRKMGLTAQLYNFLQNLAEEARARDNMVLAVSIPASELEMNPEDQRDYEAFHKLLDRLGKALVMSAETETVEIIRRRLFEWQALPDDGRRAADAFAEWALDHRQLLAEVDVDTIRGRFRDSYPFHPALLSVFERKWQTLPRFQRTRGVLRLLALWVSQTYVAGYKGAHKDPLLGLGTAPLDDLYFRAAMFEQLGSDALEGPVTTDIAGDKNAHALRLDREAPDAVRKARLHQKAATAILFESNGGMTRDEATVPEVRFAVGEPDLDVANVETVLDSLVGACYYLQASERNRYRFTSVPTLNKILIDRRASIPDGAIEKAVRDEVQPVFKTRAAGMEPLFFPEKSGQVPNRPALTLVVMSPDQPLADPATRRTVETIVREYGSTGRTFKSALLFAVPDTTAGLRDEARNLLAYQDIAGDADTVSRLDEGQAGQLDLGRKKAQRDLREAVWRAYKYVLLLGKDNQLKEVDLGLIHSSMAGSLTELIVNRLRQEDEITEGVGPRILTRYWPPARTDWSTKAVRDAFFSSPALPRLLDPNAIRRTIADGVTQGYFAYAGRDAQGRFEPLYFKTPLAEADVEISDDVVLLTAEEAIRHIEPPRLARLEIEAGIAQVEPGQIVVLSVRGYDQSDHPFAVEAPLWTATGGTIDFQGRYVAEAPGTYTIGVQAADIAATIQVHVADSSVPPPPPPPPPLPKAVSWQGDVPPQKWMNFYTKVLSRFATTPGLKLQVRFDLPADGTITDAKLEETRIALRELGLSETLEQG